MLFVYEYRLNTRYKKYSLHFELGPWSWLWGSSVFTTVGCFACFCLGLLKALCCTQQEVGVLVLIVFPAPGRRSGLPVLCRPLFFPGPPLSRPRGKFSATCYLTVPAGLWHFRMRSHPSDPRGLLSIPSPSGSPSKLTAAADLCLFCCISMQGCDGAASVAQWLIRNTEVWIWKSEKL